MFSDGFDSAFHFNDAANVNSPMKDVGFMDFETGAGDGDGSAMYGASTCTFPQQPGQFVHSTNKPNPQLPSHRGSTSSSSSLRSTDSGSPPTSAHATPIKTSPREWTEEMGGNEDTLSMDSNIDISQYLTLSGGTSSPTPPATIGLSPESHTSIEPLSQGRAVKRRKAQPKRRTVSFSLIATNIGGFILTLFRGIYQADRRAKSQGRVLTSSPLCRRIFLATSRRQMLCILTCLLPMVI